MSPEQSPKGPGLAQQTDVATRKGWGVHIAFLVCICSTWIENATSSSNLTIMIQVQSFKSRSTHRSPVHSFKRDF